MGGTDGEDLVLGTTGDDLFDALDGSDTYLIGPEGGFDAYADSGASGTDRIVATEAGTAIGLASGFGPDSGIEEIAGDGHAEVSITGGDGADLLDFSATALTGIARINGGLGGDAITGSAGDDDIRGGNGSDTLRGGEGADRLCGGGRNDLMAVPNSAHGPDGNDHLDGGAGDDELAGGAGDDVLLGGAGDDLLQGGEGDDRLAGGSGADLFRLLSAQDGSDAIADFEQGADRIDLSRLDARPGDPDRDAFLFGGEAPGARPFAVTWHAEGGATIVEIDTDGDRAADLTLTLLGTHALGADDFVL